VNFADHDPIPEPPSMKDRFDRLDADVALLKQGLGVLMAGLATGHLALTPELAEAFGLKVSGIVPGGIVRAS
jgi:hypothetical protein